MRAWDVQAGVVLRIGPLDRESFTALLPDRPTLERLVALVRAYLGFATGFAINPVVAAAAVPALQLRADADPPPRLGWNSWLTAPAGSRTKDASEAVFEAEVVEARMAARPPAAA
jgi:type VI secretion system protein ImpH